MRRTASTELASVIATEIGDVVEGRQRLDVARREVTAELDAVPERRHPGDGLQPVGQPLDGEERAREEEDGEEEEAEDGGQRRVVFDPARERRHRRGEGKPAEHGRERG